MRLSKYDLKDLIAVKNGEATIDEVARKYDTSIVAIKSVMSRKGIWRKKRRVRLVMPHKDMICNSIEECASITNVTSPTLKRALEGEDVPALKKLNIKVEYVKEVYYDEQIGEEYTDS